MFNVFENSESYAIFGAFLYNNFIILGFVKIGEEGVSRGVGGVDLGKVECLGIGEEGGINRAAADDEDFFGGVLVVFDKGVKVVNNLVWAAKFTARNDDVFAVWEFAREGVPSFAAHDDGMTSGGLFEELQVFLKMENKLAASANLAVFASCSY